MEKETLIEQISAIKEELRDMVNNAEVQTRSLNDEEKATFEQKQNELEELKRQLAEAEEAEQKALEAAAPKTDKNKFNKRNMEKSYLKNLAKQISDVVNNRSLEGYDNVSGNTINLRDDAYTTKTAGDVDDYQNLEYTRVIEPLEDAVIFQKLGMTFMNTGSLVKLPSVSNVDCTINGENTKLDTQKIAYDAKAITPVRLGCAVGLSNTAVKTIDNNVNLVAYALKAMREAEGRLINKMVVSPVAVTNDGVTVKGPFVDLLAGDASVAGKANWANIVALETAVKNKNAEIVDGACFIMSPDTADKLRSKPIAVKAPYGDRFIMEDGKIDGFPVYQTNAVNALDASGNVTYSYIGFIADPKTIIVQEVGAPDLVIDPFTRAKWNETELVLNDNLGFNWERDEVFAAMKIDSSSWTA
jgi:HK97 family phage major capsid protein